MIGLPAFALVATPGSWLNLPPVAGLALAALLVLLNGFFVAAEFALVKVRKTQLATHQDSLRGRRALHMVENLDAYLSACQLGITLASLALGWIGEPTVARLLRAGVALIPGLELPEPVVHTVALVLGFSAITTAHIVLGEQAPKVFAIRKPEPTSLWISVPLHLFFKTSYPAIWALNKMANGTLRLIGLEPSGHDVFAQGEEEIRRLVASSAETRLEEHKRELLDNVFELSHRVARQVMVPRADVVYMDRTRPIEDSIELARKTGHTRFPLCDGDLDQLTGMIHIKDLFLAEERPASLDLVRRETFFIPETLPLDRLLRRMRSAHIHMAAVLDEYGSVSGIVTLENVIEEIVGEIQDEFDQELPEITQIGEGVYQMLGSVLIQDVEQKLDIDLGDERDEDTLAGVVLSELGRRAKVGDRVELQGLGLEVLEVEHNRILSVRVSAPQPAASDLGESIGE